MIFRRRGKVQQGVCHKPHCSFCGKEHGTYGGSGRRVELVAGPGVYICSECISLCVEILQGRNPPAPASS